MRGHLITPLPGLYRERVSVLSLATIHSSGINWGQALATWVPIVISLGAALTAVMRWVRRWQEVRAKRVENLVMGLIQSFATTLNVRFEQVEHHLQDQDSHLEKQDDRLTRIDRNTGTDST